MSKQDSAYKRVLTISNVPVTPYSAQGASRGSWFKDWDKQALAMMSFAKADDDNDFAGYFFHVTLEERFGGNLFKSIFRPAKAQNNPANTPLESKYKKQKNRFKKTLKMLIGLFMFPRYSENLKKFMDDFKPDVIFSTVADCYGARLAGFLAKKNNIPYIIQQEDNWLVSDVQSSILKPLVVAIRKQCLKKALKRANKRYVICPGMKDYFEDIFNLEFESLLCADDPNRFLAPLKHDKNKKTIFSYIGNSRPNRSGEYIKIAKAIKQANIINPELRIYSSNAYKEDVEQLNAFGFVHFYHTPHHNDVPKVLSESNVLLLVESFDAKDIEYTKLALSSKVQIYMMAKVPILVFASEQTGVMDYVKKTGFGLAVTQDDINVLADAVGQIVNNQTLRDDLVKIAYQTAMDNHSAKKIRANLKTAIEAVCEQSI